MNGVVNLFRKLINVIMGKSQAVVDSFESPEDKLRFFINGLNKEMDNLQKSVVLAMTEEKKLNRQIDSEMNKANEWEKRAVLALESNDENLAREALLKKEEHEKVAIGQKAAWEQQKAAVDNLRQTLKATQLKVDNAKREYTVALARYSNAKAHNEISKKLEQGSLQSPLNLIDQLNEKIMSLESDTEARADLGADHSSSDVNVKFLELERKKKGQDALEALRLKMSDTTARDVTPKKQLVSGKK